MNIVLLFGGRGAEHAVSVKSAACVLRVMRKRAYTCFPIGVNKAGGFFLFRGTPDELTDTWEAHALPVCAVLRGGRLSFVPPDGTPIRPDLVFSVLHGKDGEDGTMQGLFTLTNTPFVGSGVGASALCMNKRLCKELALYHGIPTPAFVRVKRLCEETVTRITERLSFPVFVKPTSSGSSVGVSRVANEEALADAILLALAESEEAIVEEAVEGSELEVAVLEKDGTLLLSPPGEIRTQDGFYDYNAKYKEKKALVTLPAPIPLWETALVKQLAATLFRLFGCRDLARVDFLRRADGKIFFNEINTLPGFTEDSLFARLFSLIGVDVITFLTEGRV